MAYYEGEIAPMGANCNNNGWNDWSWIIGLAVVGGIFGNGGFGFGNGVNRGNCATQADLSAGFANSEIMSDLNDILLGQATMQNFINQGFAGVNASITDVGYAIKDCCCQTGRAIDGVNYNLATQFGALNNTLCSLGRDIIENQNANYRALHDELVANKIEAKNERIAELTMQLNRADLRASQEAQNAYLLSELKPCPKASYIVQPPQQVTFPTNCCGNVNYANFGFGGCGTSVQ